MAIAKFGALAAEASTVRHATLEAAAKMFLKRAQDAIGTYEYGWPPLSPDTIRRKETGDSPLLETGEMKDSGGYEVHHDYAIVGFTDPKTHLHEWGDRHTPPRPIIGGTIDHHGQEIANQMGVVFGEILGEALVIGGVASSAARVLGKLGL
jgi:phage gpG-like protein